MYGSIDEAHLCGLPWMQPRTGLGRYQPHEFSHVLADPNRGVDEHLAAEIHQRHAARGAVLQNLGCKKGCGLNLSFEMI